MSKQYVYVNSILKNITIWTNKLNINQLVEAVQCKNRNSFFLLLFCIFSNDIVRVLYNFMNHLNV